VVHPVVGRTSSMPDPLYVSGIFLWTGTCHALLMPRHSSRLLIAMQVHACVIYGRETAVENMSCCPRVGFEEAPHVLRHQRPCGRTSTVLDFCPLYPL
jgi:hypothetical protein